VTRPRTTVLLGVLLLQAGCGAPAEERSADTGARTAARAFFDALGRRDWAAAHDALDPESRQACSPTELARRGEVYLKRVGFDSFLTRVSACEERGDEATAHLVLTGRGHGRRDYKEAVIVKQREEKWGVVLPQNFGKH
jgi:hypothetical protein